MHTRGKLKRSLRWVCWQLIQLGADLAYDPETLVNGIGNYLVIDIDGVIAREVPKRGIGGWNSWFLSKELMPGAQEAINTLRKDGWKITLFTCRNETNRKATKAWLAGNGIKYDLLVMNKPYSKFIIDDRAIRFTDWETVLKEVKDARRHGA